MFRPDDLFDNDRRKNTSSSFGGFVAFFSENFVVDELASPLRSLMRKRSQLIRSCKHVAPLLGFLNHGGMENTVGGLAICGSVKAELPGLSSWIDLEPVSQRLTSRAL